MKNMKDVTPWTPEEVIPPLSRGAPHLFKPGQSGNPAGKPKGAKSFKTRIMEIADQRINWKDMKNKTKAMDAGEAVVMVLFKKALKGDLRAINVILEHTKENSVTLNNNQQNITIENVVDARNTIRTMLELAAKGRAIGRTIEDELA